MDIGHVKFIRPQNPQLLKWIKGYYVHSSEDAQFYTKLTFYQNITTTISIYKHSVTTSQGRKRKQHFKENTGFSSLLVGLVDKYQEVEFYGPLDRLAIVFYPCGINQFMRQALGPQLETHYSHFHYFDEFFSSFLPGVYSEPSLEKKRDMLDGFFLEHFQLLDEVKLMQAVDYLVNKDHTIQVEELATYLKLSRRTLLRKFKKHLGYSVEDYKSVIKFRKALLQFQNQESLTKVALESKYYDQSDFNHQIKYRTDLAPGALFKELRMIDDTLIWKL